MGKMKINATPEGADFEFSGGDLNVDLLPHHVQIKPVVHYYFRDSHHNLRHMVSDCSSQFFIFAPFSLKP